MKDDDWVDKHITYDGEWYYAWDETGADTIGFFLTLEAAKSALKAYAIDLERGN